MRQQTLPAPNVLPTIGTAEPAEMAKPSAPWATPSPPRRRLRWWIVPLVIGLVVAVMAAGLATVGHIASEGTVEWDGRVRPLVDFVERERGLEFDHPVPIEFLSDAAWKQQVRTQPGELSDEDRRAGEKDTQVMRALGLAEGAIDLLEENELATDFYVAYYDPEEERVYAHGDDHGDLDVQLRGTLVHELTHALQDQHFDLGEMADDSTSAAQLAMTGLIEGDASNIEAAWVDRLSSAEQDEYYAAADDVAVDPTAEVPAALAVFADAPYSLGPALATILRDAGRLDHAFTEPPSTDEHLFDPVSYLEHDVPENVSKPELPDTAKLIDDDQFGAIALYAVLAERVDPFRAFSAAAGWGGDAYRTYRLDGRTCVRANFTGETNVETTNIRHVLDEWVQSLPTPFASVRSAGENVLLESCDPGAAADLATGRSYAALALPAAHGEFEAMFVSDGATPTEARCAANGVIKASTLADLQDPEADYWMSEQFATQLDTLAGNCRGQ